MTSSKGAGSVNCCVCDSSNLIRLGQVGSKAAAVTSDSALIAHASVVWRCMNCGLLQKIHSEKDLYVIAEIYKHYAGHRLSDGREQLVFPPGLLPRPRSYHALEQCLPSLPKNGNLLDFGAGDGAVLKSAGKLLPGWQLHAFDLTDKYREEILILPGVNQFTSGVTEQLLRGHYDLITLWHSLEHVPSPAQLLRTLSQWLKPNGQILIQVPDVSRNPYDLGVVDHVSHFTDDTLRFCAHIAGFEIVMNGHEWTHNCHTVLMASKKVSTVSSPNVTEVAVSNEPFGWLNSQLQHFAQKVGEGSYSIFGTGMASLLLAAQLPGRLQCYLDEDDRRIGTNIDGIPIVHPKDAASHQSVVMPFMPATSNAIIRRLVAVFPSVKSLNFLCSQ